MQFAYNPEQRLRDARALDALDRQMPGALRFYRRRNRLAWAAFFLRCAVVGYTAVLYIVLMGNYVSAANTLAGLVVAGALCILVSRGSWAWALFWALWGAMSLWEAIPILKNASGYIVSFVGLAVLECAAGGAWLVFAAVLLVGGARFGPAVSAALKRGPVPPEDPVPTPEEEPAPQVELIAPLERAYAADSADGQNRVALLSAQWNGHALALDHCPAETRLLADGLVVCALPGGRRTRGFCLTATVEDTPIRAIVLPRPGGYSAALYARNQQLAKVTG